MLERTKPCLWCRAQLDIVPLNIVLCSTRGGFDNSCRHGKGETATRGRCTSGPQVIWLLEAVCFVNKTSS